MSARAEALARQFAEANDQLLALWSEPPPSSGGSVPSTKASYGRWA
jgi:hypothetical protein